MDQWRVESAYRLFEEAGNIRAVNGKQNPLAAVFVFHNLHGKAMAQRYRGKAATARSEYDEVLARIDAESKQATRNETPRPGRQRYAWDLRERKSNALERRADCELYEGAASAPQTVDLAEGCRRIRSSGQPGGRSRGASRPRLQTLPGLGPERRCRHGRVASSTATRSEPARLSARGKSAFASPVN